MPRAAAVNRETVHMKVTSTVLLQYDSSSDDQWAKRRQGRVLLGKTVPAFSPVTARRSLQRRRAQRVGAGHVFGFGALN